MISIYPNPCSGKLFVCGMEECRRLRVFDENGEEVYHTVPASTHSVINLSSKPSGIYFIAANTTRGFVFKRVTVKR